MLGILVGIFDGMLVGVFEGAIEGELLGILVGIFIVYTYTLPTTHNKINKHIKIFLTFDIG